MKLIEKATSHIFYALKITEEMLTNPKPVLEWLKKYGGEGALYTSKQVFLVGGDVQTVSSEYLMFEELYSLTMIQSGCWFLVNNETTYAISDEELSEYEECE